MNPTLRFTAVIGLVAAICVAIAGPFASASANFGAGLTIAFGVSQMCRPDFGSLKLYAIDSGYETMSDLITRNLGADSPVGEVLLENIVHAPELDLFPAEIIDGMSFPSTIRTGIPSPSGIFRDYNQGVAQGKASYKNVQVQCKIATRRVEVDKAVADSYRKGAIAWQMIRSSEEAEVFIRGIGKQIYYGASNEAKGFPGFTETVDPAMEVDATGTTANGKTSVWAVKFGVTDVTLLFGNGMLLDLNPTWRVESITPDPSAPTLRLDGYVNQWQGFPGLQILKKHVIARIKNITDQTDKGLTLTRLFDLLEKFPTGVRPDAIFMTRHSLGQERKSRISQYTPDPLPLKDVDGVPIITTDSISLTEA